MGNTDVIVREAANTDQKTWNRYVNHPLQTWEWGEFRRRSGGGGGGTSVARYIVRNQSSAVSEVWQMTFHPVPHTPWTVGYFPKGPKPTKEMVNELKKIGKEQNAIFIQLEPNVLSSFQFPVSSFQLIPSHHPLFTNYTFILDLTKSEEELLKTMHSKTRYNIRVAQKHGVIVKEDNSDSAFQEYLKLSEETTRRQGFYAHNQQYHKTLWQTLKGSGIPHLWNAVYEGETLVSWMIFAWKDTLYYPYGASSRNHREVMAPNLLLWEIAKWGKAHGYKKFDLWGALGPSPTGEPDPNDPWYGFHRFKEGYNPELVEYVGSYDLVINSMLYKLYCIMDTIRWLLLKLKMKL